MKPGECDVYYPGGTVPGQMGWIKFLAISSTCGLVENNKKLAFPAQHAYSRLFLDEDNGVSDLSPCCFITGFLVSNVRHSAANE